MLRRCATVLLLVASVLTAGSALAFSPLLKASFGGVAYLSADSLIVSADHEILRYDLVARAWPSAGSRAAGDAPECRA
jgi:hypothetical protein